MGAIKVALISLGCSKNLVDSEAMLADLKEKSYVLTTDPAEACVIVINTCGFIDTAKEESIETILTMARHKEKKCRLLLAAGCLVQRYQRELLTEIPELDGIIGTDDLYGVSEAIRRGLAGEKVSLTEGRYPAPDGAPRLLSTPSHYAYLKIAEGCDNRCTYCAIPAIRGSYRSRDLGIILAEAEALVAGGARELNLIAQDITLYGYDLAGTMLLPKLLQEMARLDNLLWIRLLYAYPERLNESIIAMVAGENKICKYLDLPLQHGADPILRRMGRKMTADGIIRLVERLRRDIPGITLRSSFIIGFPGEGDKDFSLLLDFLSELRLDRVGFFAYSQEEGTAAASFSGQVPEAVKQERLGQAVALQSKVIREKHRKLLGHELEVMLDGRSAQDPGITLARTSGHAPEVDGYVRLDGTHRPYGNIVRARVYGFEEVDLLGKII
jgi:ribosomal protein S12 methylthiotransferase